jgi:hypothetical protein
MVTPEELAEIVKVILELIHAVKISNDDYKPKIDVLRSELESTFQSVLAEKLSTEKAQSKKEIDILAQEVYKKISEIKSLIPLPTDLSELENEISYVAGLIPEEKVVTGDEIIMKINESDGIIKKERIEGWEELDKRITSASGPRSSFGVRTQMGSSFSFAGNGVTTTFYLPKEPAGKGMFIYAHYQGQWLQQGVHYSLKGRTFNTAGGTAAFTPDDGTVIEGFLINF